MNVLFIAIDDQNDWIGHLGGHPLAKAPHLDRLAARGTTFLNAHVQSPLCNPSRTSLMLGLRPTTTGIYGLSPWFRNVEAWQDRVTLPQHFKAHGYRTDTSGKIDHGAAGGPQKRAAEFDVWGPVGGIGAKPENKLIPPTPMGNHPAMDWGVFPHRDEDKGHYQVASWTIEQIKKAPQDQPFFIAAGFFLPHVPCYATQKWFDLYPDDDPVLPKLLAGDRDETPRFSWYLHWHLPEPRLKWFKENRPSLATAGMLPPLPAVRTEERMVGKTITAVRDFQHQVFTRIGKVCHRNMRGPCAGGFLNHRLHIAECHTIPGDSAQQIPSGSLLIPLGSGFGKLELLAEYLP